MKCPLRPKYKRFLWWRWVVGCEDCLKEKCAWFHPTTQSCEVSRIASNLSTIANFMECLGDTKTQTAMDTKTEAQHMLAQVESIRNNWGVNTDYGDVAPELEEIERLARRIMED